jgi:tRNA threonylcarbamoyladenosine biosynthesis protein TsaB
MRLLAIDSATEACSVALWEAGWVGADYVWAPRGHTQALLPMIEQQLALAGWSLAQLDGIVCTQGPGSFSGVRIGIAAAQGLAYAANLPTLGVSSLAALAWQGAMARPELSRWQVVVDARMQEVYTAGFGFHDQQLNVISAEALVPLDAVTLWTGPEVGRVGQGWLLLNTRDRPIETPQPQPHAWAAAALAEAQLTQGTAQWISPEHLQPVYLRASVT